MAAFTFVKETEKQKDQQAERKIARSEISSELDKQTDAFEVLSEDIQEVVAAGTKVGEQVIRESNQTGALSAIQEKEAKKVGEHMASLCQTKNDFQQISYYFFLSH